MKWISAGEWGYMPPNDGGNVLVDVWATRKLPNITHDDHEVWIGIRFYKTLYFTYENQYSFDGISIHEILFECCGDNEERHQRLVEKDFTFYTREENMKKIIEKLSPEERSWTVREIWRWLPMWEIQEAENG